MTTRSADIAGFVSLIVLGALVSLEFWAPFYHVWDVQVVGFLLNSAVSFYAARRANRRWYALVAANLTAIIVWFVGLGD
jgi:membrane protein implicated in regulation of membrane protease activity